MPQIATLATNSIVEAVTNGARGWGASSLLFALPVLLPFAVNAICGGWMAACFEYRLAAVHCRRRALRVFFIALWREGYTSVTRINLWLFFFPMIFLAVAGSSIFLASSFSALGYYDPRLSAVMLVSWFVLSSGGWLFTITTAQRPVSMAVAATLLLIVFMQLGVLAGGST